jgi:hypothetical protein
MQGIVLVLVLNAFRGFFPSVELATANYVLLVDLPPAYSGYHGPQRSSSRIDPSQSYKPLPNSIVM